MSYTIVGTRTNITCKSSDQPNPRAELRPGSRAARRSALVPVPQPLPALPEPPLCLTPPGPVRPSPVLQKNVARLLGVAGTDVPLSDIQKHAPPYMVSHATT